MTPACFICHGSEFTESNAHYRRCQSCGHETLTRDAAQTFMLNDALDAGSVARASVLDRFQGDVLDRFVAGRRRCLLVDIGSGSGKFLLLQRCKFERHCGIEITPAALAFSRETLGLTVVSNLDQVEGEIDVATAWHSLEHFPAIALETLLRQLAARLADGGCVIVSVPNAASFQYRIFGRRYAFFDVPNHLHQFTPDSLARIFAAHGFLQTRSVVSWPYNLFGYVQALLNVLTPEHNALYYRLKRGRATGGFSTILSVVLLPIAIPLGGVLGLLDIIFPRRQGVLTCCFEKRGSPR